MTELLFGCSFFGVCRRLLISGVGMFKTKHNAKMDFKLNLLNQKERSPDDAPSLAIILCAEKYNFEVEFALKRKPNPIGVAEYPSKAAWRAR